MELLSDSLLALSLNHSFWSDQRLLSLEAEAGFARHFETHAVYESTGAIVLRWLNPPWSKSVGGSVAFGNGLSYASRVPESEITRLPLNSKLLYYLLFDLSVSLPRQESWELLFRVHHRSGIFGLFGGVSGGSDFLCLGLRLRLR